MTEPELKAYFARFVKICGVARVAEWTGVSTATAGRWQRQEFLPKAHHVSALWQGFQREFEHDEGLLRKFIQEFKELSDSRAIRKATAKLEKKLLKTSA